MKNIRRYVAIYCRVSTGIQKEKGVSLEHQPQMVREMLAQKFGDVPFEVEIFTDAGMSGTLGPKPYQESFQKGDRPQLFEMLKRIKAGEFTDVAAYDSSRIYRRFPSLLTFISDIIQPKHMGLHFVKDDADLDTAEGMLQAGIQGLFADMQ